MTHFFHFDTNEILLDKIQNNKQIFKNLPSILEKLQMINFASQFVLEVESTSTKYAGSLAIESLLMIIVVHLIHCNHFIIVSTKEGSRNEKLVDYLMYQQMLVNLILISMNIFFIYWQSFVQFDIINIAMLIIFNIFAIGFFISNYMKCFHQFILMVWLIILAFSEIDHSTLISLLELISALVMQEVWALIQQKVIVKSNLERSERVDMSFETMHDLRNQVYSYIELTQTEPELTDHKTKGSDITNVLQNSFSNVGNIQISHLFKSLDFENKETQYHQRFILFKICFLQHMELIQENMYQMKPKLYDIKDLIVRSSETLKILLMNKNNNLIVELQAQVQSIIIDPHIFEQVIVDLVRLLHMLRYDDIYLSILLKYHDNNLELRLKATVGTININSIKEINGNSIIKRLIETLANRLTQEFYFEPTSLTILIKFPITLRRQKAILKRINKKSDVHSETLIQDEVQNIKKKDAKFAMTSNANGDITSLSVSKEMRYNDDKDMISKNDHNPLESNLDSNEIQIEGIQLEDMDEKVDTDVIFGQRNSGCKTVNRTKGSSLINPSKNYKRDNVGSDHDQKEEQVETTRLETKSMKANNTQLKRFIQNWTFVEQTQAEGLIYINTDDEENILRMHSRIFSKEGAALNCVKSGAELMNLLVQIYQDYKRVQEQDGNARVPSILAVMDHMLDNEQGYEAVENATQLNELLKLDLTFVLLSSTEDKDTLARYTKAGVNDKIAKPLNKKKLKTILDSFRKEKDFVMFQEMN